MSGQRSTWFQPAVVQVDEWSRWNRLRADWLALGFDTRSAGALANGGCKTVAELRMRGIGWLKRLPNIGPKSVRRIEVLIGANVHPARPKAWRAVNPLICTFGEWRPGEPPT